MHLRGARLVKMLLTCDILILIVLIVLIHTVRRLHYQLYINIRIEIVSAD